MRINVSLRRTSRPLLWFAIALMSAVALTPRAQARMSAAPTATYHVAISGSDNDPGTAVSPWRTIQRAASAMGAGGTVVVHAGAYNERVLVSNSGTPGALITFQAEGSVVMKGFNLQASYVRIAGFEITDVPGINYFDPASSAGIYVTGSFDEVSDNYIHHTNSAGIHFSTAASNNIIRSNRVVSAVDSGLNIQGSNHLIVSNDISHSVQTHSGMVNFGDADGIRFFGFGSTFRRNYIHDITQRDPGNEHAPHIDGFQTWGPCSDMVIEQNTIWQVESPESGITLEGLLQPVGNIIIRNNVFLTSGMEFAPAVLAGDVGIVTNTAIVNNTIVALNGPTEYAIRLFRNLSTAVVKNNAIYNHGTSTSPYIQVDAGASGLAIGFNSISKSDGQAPAGSPYPNDLWLVDPGFLDFSTRNFHLKPTSPLTKAGIALSIVPNDFDSVPRLSDGPSDIGAFRTNLPPVVDAGPGRIVTLPASAALKGAVHDDGLPVDGTLTAIWSIVSGPGLVTFGDVNAPTTTATFATFGSYILQLAASDGALPTTANVAITVNPPVVANAGPDQTVQATGPDGVSVDLLGSATGGKPDELTFTWNGPFGTLHGTKINPVIPLGAHIIGLEVTDPYGGYATANVTVTVQNTTSLIIKAANASPSVLWPPNHRLVDVIVRIEVSDIADANPACSIASITSNQPINATGDGNTNADWSLPSGSTKGNGDLLLQLRAERSGSDQTPRIYTLQIKCADVFGNTATRALTVTVPFDGRN